MELDPNASELNILFTFLGRIQQDQILRDQLNEVITAPDVVAIAAAGGFCFQTSTRWNCLSAATKRPWPARG